ncbi:MAG: alanine--tRNA ligase [Verrucomicrobia bacterium]|nr:alanine--tRNA ligase [Verrucomicrobiota bacterium]
MTSAEIRQSFLDFFKEQQHTIVPSASLLPTTPNLLFTNSGMAQFVPYFLGEQQAPYSPARAVDTQKCIRAGGKHNDLDDVGLDTYHHTFFEMLGNWSFGDYFKKEAIAWAWELVVNRWKFPANRVYATVYAPGEGDPSVFDQEAYDHWAVLFEKAGLDPKVHIVNGNRKDNFWMMGETGPCGPCSELHIDLTPAGDTKGSLVNTGDARCIEIWNLVFIQFNANPDGTFSPLPAKHVDTGMGLERVASIIQGTKNFTDFTHAKISNYETDLFHPLFRRLEELSGKNYGCTLPKAGSHGETEQEKIDVAFRVIADHIRTLSFSIADGIEPGNNERNYVLRRILRRAVRYGRVLGFRGPFFHKLVSTLGIVMGDVFPELREHQSRIERVLQTEEVNFGRTLDRGIDLFESTAKGMLNESCKKLVESTAVGMLASSLSPRDAGVEESLNRSLDFLYKYPGKDFKELVAQAQKDFPNWSPSLIGAIPGERAFELYDTYGFPLDLTEILAQELGLKVDRKGAEKRMELQRQLGRDNQKKTMVMAGEEDASPTDFVGFEQDVCETSVVDLRSGPKGETFALVTRSPLYAEMGGQVGDTGLLTVGNEQIPVLDTIKRGQTFFLKLERNPEGSLAGPAVLHVDEPRRRAIEAHHTATHLLHWALHEIVDKRIEQKGSFVGPDRLRFDFNSGALTAEQLAAMEELINQRTLRNDAVSWVERPYAEVKANPAIMQFFGDKYGATVRVVQIGGEAGALNGYSMELCGGTHVRATGQCGAFAIVSEGAIAAGVRRIEAVSGLAALHYFRERQAKADARLKELDGRVLELGKALEKERAAQLAREAGEIAERQMQAADNSGAVPRIISKLDLSAGGPELLPAVLNALKSRDFHGVALFAGLHDGSAHFAVSVSANYTSKFQAGKLVGALAPSVGGKGGGRPDLARGAGRETSGLEALLAKARELTK